MCGRTGFVNALLPTAKGCRLTIIFNDNGFSLACVSLHKLLCDGRGGSAEGARRHAGQGMTFLNFYVGDKFGVTKPKV